MAYELHLRYQLLAMHKKILVVDDDDGIRDAIEALLLEFDYEVCLLGHADEIFETIDYYQPDLILLDVMLGGSSGITICATLKAEATTQHIPVILISAHYQFTSDYCGTADGFVSKPFDIKCLLQKIEGQLAA